MRSTHRVGRRVALIAGVLAAVMIDGAAVLADHGDVGAGRIAIGQRVDGNADVYSLQPNGAAVRRLTNAPGFDACPDYSADGKWIAFCSDRSGALEIWTMKQNGTQQHQLTSADGFLAFPDWSPDGSTVALCGSIPAGSGDHIWAIGADGTGLVQLTDDPARDCFPTFSPDGTTIAFVRFGEAGGELWLMDADGGNERQLTFDGVPKNQLPEWSPDGRQLAYNGGEALWVIDSDGTDAHVIADLPGTDLGPAWSSDGDRIAFVNLDPDGVRSLLTTSPDGSGVERVGDGVGYLVPSWQPRAGA